MIIKNFFKDLLKDRRVVLPAAFFLLISAIAYLVWQKNVGNLEHLVFQAVALAPVKYYLLVVGINTILGLSAFRKEIEITYLFFTINSYIALFFLVLSIYYLNLFNR